jgi:hypothetical protein
MEEGRNIIAEEKEEEIITEPETEESKAEKLRLREETTKLYIISNRNQLLEKTDRYLLSDFPITPEQLEIVKQYRQALRDFTNNNYEMPEKPDFVITLN